MISPAEPYFSVPARADRLRAAALRWVGTPCRHRCAKPGRRGGVDCICLAGAVMAEVGYIEHFDPAGLPLYSLDWSSHNREDVLTPALHAFLGGAYAVIDDPAALQVGDVVIFRVGHVPHHLGIMLGPDELLHAVRPIGATVVERGHFLFKRNFHQAWRLLERAPIT